MGPLPPAVGRGLFAPELRDMAVSLQGNTVALRLSALWTVSTLWLYLSGLLVGVTLWVLYRWWPLRRGTQVTGLLIAMAMMLIITSAFGLDGGAVGRRPDDTDHPRQPGGRTGARVRGLGPTPEQPARADAHPRGDRRRMSDGDHLRGYRQLSTGTVTSLSPIEARTPENQPIATEEVGALYGDIVVVAATDRMDQAPTSCWVCGSPTAPRSGRCPATT